MVRHDSALIATRSAGPELLDTKAAAVYLGVRPHTLDVWRLTQRYALPYIRVGRRIRYRRDHLDRFLESRTVGAPAETAA